MAPCVEVDLDDAGARLLAQALNHIHGEDDLGLRAELLREVLATISEDEVAAILPDTRTNLDALVSMGQETIADYLQRFEKARAARLRPLRFRLAPEQVGVVEEAITRMLSRVSELRADSPNDRGTALYLLCRDFLGRKNDSCHVEQKNWSTGMVPPFGAWHTQ